MRIQSVKSLAALLALLGSVFVVSEGQTGMVLNFGRVSRSDISPGLHFKWPLVETARVFDRRLQVLDSEPERYLTSERKDVSVDFFAVGMIQDVRAFYRATGGDESLAVQRLVGRAHFWRDPRTRVRSARGGACGDHGVEVLVQGHLVRAASQAAFEASGAMKLGGKKHLARVR